jgi:DNA-directed RNA polymerase specialized sigma24 family protein
VKKTRQIEVTDGRLVKIVGSILQNAHDLAEWGLETRNLTEDDLRMIVLRRDPQLRREAARKLIESGVSRRQTAKLLGVDEGTIRNDLRKDSAKSAEKVRTGATNRYCGPIEQMLRAAI